jgi:hypothetical protein
LVRLPLIGAAAAASAFLLISGAAAAPVYPVTAGTLTYINSYLGSGLGDNFNFTGPLVSITGGGATAVAYSGLQSLNVPFAFSLLLAIDDTGDESGPAMANGTPYASVQYTGTAAVHATSDVTLTSGHLMVSVPGFIDGTLNVCNTSAICSGGGGIPDHVFDVSFPPLTGTLTLTFEQFNGGSTYDLTNAAFTTSIPEPASWWFVAAGLGLVTMLRRATRKHEPGFVAPSEP